jgi:lipoate-protein ligase A
MILLDFDAEALVSTLRLTSEKLKDKLAKDFKERLTWVSKELGRSIEMNELISIAKDSFSEALGVKLVKGQYTEEEKKLISRFRLKYSSPDWIYNLRKRLSGDVKFIERKFPGGLVRLQVKLAGGSIIESVLLTGDFFVEPRGAIYDLESRLKWSRVDELEENIREWYKGVKILGISENVLISLFNEVLKKNETPILVCTCPEEI